MIFHTFLTYLRRYIKLLPWNGERHKEVFESALSQVNLSLEPLEEWKKIFEI